MPLLPVLLVWPRTAGIVAAEATTETFPAHAGASRWCGIACRPSSSRGGTVRACPVATACHSQGSSAGAAFRCSRFLALLNSDFLRHSNHTQIATDNFNHTIKTAHARNPAGNARTINPPFQLL